MRMSWPVLTYLSAMAMYKLSLMHVSGYLAQSVWHMKRCHDSQP